MVLKFSQVTTKGDYSKAPCRFKNNVFFGKGCATADLEILGHV